MIAAVLVLVLWLLLSGGAGFAEVAPGLAVALAAAAWLGLVDG